jgi:hypothetical protein
MTHQEINQAIAEACGWTDVQVGTLCKELIGKSPTDGDYWPIASYVSDLNAMWEAEMRIPLLKRCEYLWYIALVCHGCNEGKRTFVTTTANARQRAEAFLRTIGKWEEEE